MVKVKIISTATLNTFTFISFPHFEFYPRRYHTIVFEKKVLLFFLFT